MLNVESGLNDGIATPFVNLFLAGAVAAESSSPAAPTSGGRPSWPAGPAWGSASGSSAARCCSGAVPPGWSAPAFRPLAVLALALFGYGPGRSVAGTNGFVAAFVAGIAFGSRGHRGGGHRAASPRRSGRCWPCWCGSLSAPSWWCRGSRPPAGGTSSSRVLALTVSAHGPGGPVADRTRARPGHGGLRRVVRARAAWPRWCSASSPYDTLDHRPANDVLGLVVVTVTLSVLLHGLTAGPLASRYAAFVATLVAPRAEHGDTAPFRTRPGLEFRSRPGDPPTPEPEGGATS